MGIMSGVEIMAPANFAKILVNQSKVFGSF